MLKQKVSTIIGCRNIHHQNCQHYHTSKHIDLQIVDLQPTILPALDLSAINIHHPSQWQLINQPFPPINYFIQKLHQIFIDTYQQTNHISNNSINSNSNSNINNTNKQWIYKKDDSEYDWYYSGELRNGEMDGVGKLMKIRNRNGLQNKDGSYYYGYFKNGVMDGQGYYIRNDYIFSYAYKGQFSNNRMDGYGQWINFHRNKYIGQFKGRWQLTDEPFPDLNQTMKQLHQKYIDSYGNLPQINNSCRESDIQQVYDKFDGMYHWYYSGELVDGEMQGTARMIKIEMQDGQSNGYGLYYQGQFRNDSMDGQGYQIQVDQRTSSYAYKGRFRNNVMDGYGQYICIDRSKYIGTWSDNNHNGYGEKMFADRSKYVGQWCQHKQHGYGYYVDPKNNKYIGQFDKDRYQGQGQIIYSDGTKFKGGFIKGLKQGRGYFVDSNGKVVKGIWVDDQLQQDSWNTNKQFYKLIKQSIKDRLQQITMWVQQYKYVQMVLELEQFGDYNQYDQLARSSDSGCMHRLFYKVYLMFGMIIRPVFMDFIGPFVPFISQFWLIRNQNDPECGTVRSDELSIINYPFLLVASIGQMVMIVLMMIKYNSQFDKQKKYFGQNAGLKAKLAKRQYNKKYGKIDFDFDFERSDLK